MKQFKKLFVCVAVAFAFCVMCVNVVSVEAATEKKAGNVYVAPYTDARGNIREQKKFRIVTDNINSFDVECAAGDRIKNLKTKKGCQVSVTSVYDDKYGTYTFGRSTISMYAEKAGTYTVKFDVVNSKGQKRGSYSVKVQAVNSNALIKKATFAGQTVQANNASMKKGSKTSSSVNATKVSGKSGKLKVTLNSQYKITGMIVVSVNKNGKFSYKKVRKGGGKITLSQAYEYSSSSAYGDSSKSATKNTYVLISYKDKFLGNSVTYSITSKRGRKEVKCVEKNALNGSTYVSYSRCPSANFTLWQY